MDLLRGPLPAWPRPVDVLAARWARLQPRARIAIGCVLVLAVLGLGELRVHIGLREWGGAPVPVLVAEIDLPPGASPGQVQHRELPPAAVPPGALSTVPADAILAFAVPAGTVLTAAHLDHRGLTASLDADSRAVPIPVEAGWGVVAGGWVDVWVLGLADDPAVAVARSRPVLELREDARTPTALVSLAADEVRAVTAGLVAGQVLLTHAPPPGGDG